MINILSNKKQECCGCSACEQICPVNSISMKRDEEGFQYPVVDKNVCIDCGKCESVCPIIQKQSFGTNNGKVLQAIGGWIKDDRIRAESSSGGAFTLFASYILENKGIVYGCAMTEGFQVKHIGVEDIKALDELRKSKYVQSDIKGIYKQIEEQLKNGRMVLFTGTPCQAAGLHSFLGKRYESLYVLDFICHGVPSQYVFDKYIIYLGIKYKDIITSFRFRLKDYEWNPTGLQLGAGTGTGTANYGYKRFSPGYKDAFMNGFLDDLYLRPSCYKCEFKSIPKYYSDITIADFWGVNKVMPELYDGKGTSLLLINSEQGRSLFEYVKDKFHYKECSFDLAIKRNQSIYKSAEMNPKRKQFFLDLEIMPFERVRMKYLTAFKWASHKIIKIVRNKLSR